MVSLANDVSLSHDRWVSEPHAHDGAAVLDLHLQTFVVSRVTEAFAEEIAAALNSPGSPVSPAANDVATEIRRLLSS